MLLRREGKASPHSTRQSAGEQLCSAPDVLQGTEYPSVCLCCLQSTSSPAQPMAWGRALLVTIAPEQSWGGLLSCSSAQLPGCSPDLC